MKVTLKSHCEGDVITIDVRVGKNLKQAIKIHGENTVYQMYRKAIIVQAQSKARRKAKAELGYH